MTRGILLDPRVRRWAMFVLLMAAMLMVFAGTTFLASSLYPPVRARPETNPAGTTFLESGLSMPWGFIIYWGICAWLTMAALMLALWDMLLLRIEARRERRRLEQELAKKEEDDE